MTVKAEDLIQNQYYWDLNNDLFYIYNISSAYPLGQMHICADSYYYDPNSATWTHKLLALPPGQVAADHWVAGPRVRCPNEVPYHGYMDPKDLKTGSYYWITEVPHGALLYVVSYSVGASLASRESSVYLTGNYGGPIGWSKPRFEQFILPTRNPLCLLEEPRPPILYASSPAWTPDQTPLAQPQVPVCECGATKCGSSLHSSWCAMSKA